MLSDKEIDQLEQYMVHSTLNDLPALLMRAIPLLLSELRIARAALNAQTETFLKGETNDRGGKDVEGDGGRDMQAVRGGEVVGVVAGDHLPDSGTDSDQGTASQEGANEAEAVPVPGPKPRRNRRKKGGDPERVDSGGGEHAMGRAGISILSIEPRG